MTSENSSSRIVGLDVARAAAIGGMALIHFATVLSGEGFDSSLGWAVDRAAGRPAAVFMILAGIGVSMQLRRSVDQTRRRLWRRGAFFLAFGFANLVLWPGDILRVYGVAYFASLCLASANVRKLWAVAGAVVLMFVALVLVIDFETNWDFETLEYSNLWTFQGALLNLFYNGFRAVLPWLSLFLVGMIIGKSDLRSSRVQRKLMMVGATTWVVAEGISLLALYGLEFVELDRETSVALFGTDSLPPMPLFLLSAGGFAVLGIALCVQLGDRARFRRWIDPVASAGRMAFTWYIAHIVAVVAAGVYTGFRGDVSIVVSLALSGLLFIAMVTVSNAYLKVFRQGPLEWSLRSVAG